MSETKHDAVFVRDVTEAQLQSMLDLMPMGPDVDSVYFDMLSEMCASFADKYGLGPDEMQVLLNDLKGESVSL